MATVTSKHRVDKLAVALDTPDWGEFVELAATFGPRVGVLKVGLEAYTRWGARAVAEAQRHGAAVFLDLKLHDIPNTVAGAVAAVCDQGVDYLTLHAAGGPAMLTAAADAAADRLKLLAVTLLTHLDTRALEALDLPGQGRDRAQRWALLAHAGGCHGAVCSPHEVGDLRRSMPPSFTLVTPGVRLDEPVAGDDQARTARPRQALAAGADLLVVGRPLTRARNRNAALELWAAEIAAD
jgi:orotidine-5'-phosphate decarboxylase